MIPHFSALLVAWGRFHPGGHPFTHTLARGFRFLCYRRAGLVGLRVPSLIFRRGPAVRYSASPSCP